MHHRHTKGSKRHILIIVFTALLESILARRELSFFDNVLMRMNSLLIIMNFALTSFSLHIFPTSPLFCCLTVHCAGCQIQGPLMDAAFTSQRCVTPFSGKHVFSCFPQLLTLLGFTFVTGSSFSVCSVPQGSVLGLLF